MDAHNVEFHISEYNGLRVELLSCVQQRMNSVIYTVTANAVILGFIISNVQSSAKLGGLIVITAWLPALISVLGWIHYYENIKNIHRIGRYCAEIENKFAITDFGWENHLRKIRNTVEFRGRYLFNSVFAIQLVLAIYVGTHVTGSLHS